MWAIVNRTPYKVGKAWGRDKEGVHEWIVVVKGTFDILADGSVQLAEEQAEPLLLPEYNGQDGLSSLRYDADVVAPKPATDVIVNGTAHAPRGHPSSDFLVAISVGGVRKTLRVRGNRQWGDDGQPTAMQRVARVPIVYERAYGGFDQADPDPTRQRIDVRNPVGCGLTKQAGGALPNFEYPGQDLERAGPAGFGAIASYWSPRRELNGTYDEAWQKARCPLLPTDWDERSLLCSPPDQVSQGHLRGGESVELENLTPNGRISFALPKAYLRFQTRIDGRVEEHQGRLGTVIVEPDHLRLIMVWQSSLSVRTDGDYLDDTTVSEKVRIR